MLYLWPNPNLGRLHDYAFLQIALLVVKHSLVSAEGYLECGLVVCCKDVAKCINYIGLSWVRKVELADTCYQLADLPKYLRENSVLYCI